MPARGRKKAVVAVSPEVKARAEKMRKDGKSYKEIADALKLGYDKAAWNLLNPGPTGKHRGDRVAKAPSKTVGKGRKGAGKGKAAEGSVEARRTVKKSGKKAPQTPAEVALQKDREHAAAIDRKAEESPANQPGAHELSRSLTHRFGNDRPVARPAHPVKEEVRAVPKPKDAKRK